MNRNRWIVVIAIAALLSLGLTFLLLRIISRRSQPPEENVKIVVAAQKLVLGMRIAKEDVKLADWPKSLDDLERRSNS